MFMTVCVVSANAGLMLWFAFVLFRSFAVENKDSRVMQRIRMSLGRNAKDSWTTDNSFSGVFGTEAKEEVEMVEL